MTTQKLWKADANLPKHQFTEAATVFLSQFALRVPNKDNDNRDEQRSLLIGKAICDTTQIDAELAEQHREIEITTELSRKAISENARTAQDQTEFNTRNDGYLDRQHQATTRIEELEARRRERLAKGKMLDRFIKDIKTGR